MTDAISYPATNDPDVLRVKRGGWPRWLFGMVFATAGAAFTIGSILQELNAEREEPLGPLAFLPVAVFGSLFAAAGLGVGLSHWRCEFDKRRGTAASAWCWLAWSWRRRDHTLARFTSVVLDSFVHVGKNQRRIVYSIHLDGGGGLHVATLRGEPAARRHAERLAKFLELPLNDETGVRRRRRGADTLDKSIREGLAPGARPRRLTGREPGRVRVEHGAGGVRLTTPPAGFDLRLLLPAAGLAFVGYVIAGGFRLLPFPVPALVCASAGLAYLGWLVDRVASTSLVEMDHEGVTVTHRHPLWRRRRRLPADEIEEVFAGADAYRPLPLRGALSGVVICTDRRTVVFGEPLTTEERIYAADVLYNHLAFGDP